MHSAGHALHSTLSLLQRKDAFVQSEYGQNMFAKVGWPVVVSLRDDALANGGVWASKGVHLCNRACACSKQVLSFWAQFSIQGSRL